MYRSASTSTSSNCGRSSNWRVGGVDRHLPEPQVVDSALAGDLESVTGMPSVCVVLIAPEWQAAGRCRCSRPPARGCWSGPGAARFDRIAPLEQGMRTPVVDVSPRSATSSAILRVYASASVARSSAFVNRAVAISSIVRVILRMFWTDLRRLTIARALAIGGSLRVGR